MVLSLTGANVNALIGTISNNLTVEPSHAFREYESGEASYRTPTWCGGGVGKKTALISGAKVGCFIITMEGHLTNLPAHTAKSKSNDADALAAVWETHGYKGISTLDGSFAATIVNTETGEVILVVDRFGSRPIYLCQGPDLLAYSTYLPALLKMPWCDRTLNRKVLSEYLSFNTVHAPRTLIRGITQIPAGHTAHIQRETVQIKKYWSMTYAPIGEPVPATGDYVKSLQSAVERAVSRATAHTTNPAILLSGGLGSMAIGAATRSLDIQATSYTISFTDDPRPEAPFAGRIANILGLKHHEVSISSAQIANQFDQTVRAIGHPSGNPAGILGSILTCAVSHEHETVLSGHGTDELFGGAMLVQPARELRLLRTTNLLPSRLKGMLHKSPGGRLNPEDFGLRSEIGGAHIFDLPSRESLLKDLSLLNPEVRKTTLRPYYDEVQSDPLNRTLNACLYAWLCAERLPRMSRTSAQHLITPLYPLLDAEVVALAASLPGTAKVRHRRGSLHIRWPLRTMLSGALPAPLLRRSRRDMQSPLERWLTTSGRLFLEARVDALLKDDRDLFENNAIQSLRDTAHHDPGAARKLWTLFVLHSWLEQNNIR
jgi:asparagine synthase (glutamine-hydrolysing)